MTQSTARALRLHIGLFGRRNVGKSSLLNAITRQSVSIVSSYAGTTTDPVEKPMELQPLGPVVFIDTAGLDDEGALGAQRIEKSKLVFERCDIACIICGEEGWGSFEQALFETFEKRSLPTIIIFNKQDLSLADGDFSRGEKVPVIYTSVQTDTEATGLEQLREALVQQAPEDVLQPPSILGDLLPAGGLVVFVVPIDMEAPKGRLIMPQVQAIRDTLDNDAMSLVVKERELAPALDRLKIPPDLVVTDSQSFLKVSADVPDTIPLTSFSILMARFKGDLQTLADGARAIENLRAGDRVLIAESCSHHPIGEDIGRVKIPRWLTQYVGGKLSIEHAQGRTFPEDLSEFKLVIHCGSCTFNRRSMLNRICTCRGAGVPITNYGMAIAYSLGIFPRALRCFGLT